MVSTNYYMEHPDLLGGSSRAAGGRSQGKEQEKEQEKEQKKKQGKEQKKEQGNDMSSMSSLHV